MCLKQTQNKENNECLRILANKVLGLIRIKGSKYLTKKAVKKHIEKAQLESKQDMSNNIEENS